ncbi:MAG: lamin tail domain-containing protein [Saprospiraceae bacterium]|nr:lamin tail domain-containing protein [Saprospiraceae bacterium]
MYTSVICQISDDFEDGDITNNPTWVGDVGNFIVNAEGSLQLMAPDAGRSFITTAAVFPDSFSLSFAHTFDFSPSTSNLSRFYFLLDGQDVSKANGYYLNFGENGSADAIKLYQLKAGASSLIGSGTAGAIALASNFVKLQLDFQSNVFSLKAAYDASSALVEELRLPHTIARSSGTTYIGFECIYTASRVDKFYLDDLALVIYQPDLTAPSISEVNVIDSKTLNVKFSEPLSAESLLPANFTLNPGPIAISAVEQTGSFTNFNLIINGTIQPGINYSLGVAKLTDLKGNLANNLTFGGIKRLAQPLAGEIFISEILFDPVSGGSDYLELYNDSELDVDLKGLVIKNLDNTDQKTITTTTIIPSKSYLALTADPAQVRSQYQTPTEANIIAFTLPAFNNDAGHAAIAFPSETQLDDFKYLDDYHNALLDVVDGVSLERLSFALPFGNGNYASAAKSVNYGSPGYANSNGEIASTGEESFSLLQRKFSPDSDGVVDELLLNYNLDEDGFVLNLSIFDASGLPVKKIASNELLGRNGFVRWNGLNEDGDLERPGIYLLIGTAHSLNGTVIEISKTCILAARL